MRIIFFIFLIFSFPVFAAQDIEDAFSPNQGATALVIKTIRKAEESIRVAAYSFTSQPIADALVEASKNGVDVKIVLDKSQRKSPRSLASLLREAGVPTRINSHYAIMHNKFMIIDGKVLELGSFNYTRAAEKKNAENVLVIHNDQEIIADYEKQWEKMWDEARQR